MTGEVPSAPIAGGSALDHDLAPGAVLGEFRLIRELGRGGMGIVFEAEQLSLGRRVALKVLPEGATLDYRQLNRFRQEAQAAAHLHHSNIVTVHGVGADRGIHYYSMQLIDGRSLATVIRDWRQIAGLEPRDPLGLGPDESSKPTPAGAETGEEHGASSSVPTVPIAKDSTHASWKSRERFRAVADWGRQAAEALEYIHQFGLIHRDIKPGNLLVDINNHLWLTDFGLARFQREALSQASETLVGTARYMSPEQLENANGVLDARTDVYSLGATLYELLTLVPAFPGPEQQSVLARLAGETPIPPRQIVKEIPADLETIAMTALEFRPEDRYASAKELADDLRNFLEHRPIKARRPGLPGRVASWARRKPALALAGFCLLVAATLAFAGTTLFSIHVQRQADNAIAKANQNLALAKSAVDFMYTIVCDELLDNDPDLYLKQGDFFRNALEAYSIWSDQMEGDPQFRFGAARAQLRVGEIRERLGSFQEAVDAYDAAYKKFDALFQSDPSNNEFRLALADAASKRGFLLAGLNDKKEAQTYLEQAINLHELVLRNNPDNFAIKYQLAKDWYNLVQCYEMGSSGAAQAIAETLRINTELAKNIPEAGVSAELLELKARVHFDLCSQLLRFRGNFSGAADEAKNAIRLFESLRQAAPHDRQLNESLARSYHDLGRCYFNQERMDDAEQSWRKALAIREELAKKYDGIIEYKRELAATWNNLAIALHYDGKFEKAEAAYRQAVSQSKNLLKHSGNMVSYRTSAFVFMRNLGEMFLSKQEPKQAEAILREAVGLAVGKIEENTRVPDSIYLVVAQNMLARSLLLQNEFGQANAVLGDALAELKGCMKNAGDDSDCHDLLAEVYALSADLAEREDRLDDAWRLLQDSSKAVRVALLAAEKKMSASDKKVSWRWRASVGQSIERIANFEFRNLRVPSAQLHFREAAEYFDAAARAAPESRAEILLQYARFLLVCPDRSLRDLDKANEIINRLRDRQPKPVRLDEVKGIAAYREGRLSEACSALEKSRELQLFEPYDGFFLAMAYWKLGRKDEALEVFLDAQQRHWKGRYEFTSSEWAHREAARLLKQSWEEPRQITVAVISAEVPSPLPGRFIRGFAFAELARLIQESSKDFLKLLQGQFVPQTHKTGNPT